MGIFSRDLEFRRDGSFGPRMVVATVHKLPNQFVSCMRHIGQQIKRKKTRSLRYPKLYWNSASLLQGLQQSFILFGSEARIEVSAKRGNHGRILLAASYCHPERSEGPMHLARPAPLFAKLKNRRPATNDCPHASIKNCPLRM